MRFHDSLTALSQFDVLVPVFLYQSWFKVYKCRKPNVSELRKSALNREDSELILSETALNFSDMNSADSHKIRIDCAMFLLGLTFEGTGWKEYWLQDDLSHFLVFSIRIPGCLWITSEVRLDLWVQRNSSNLDRAPRFWLFVLLNSRDWFSAPLSSVSSDTWVIYFC